ncbi:hypothetical protein J3E69DRAFT_352760 [Trichoderma sp. SZMC 28015]
MIYTHVIKLNRDSSTSSRIKFFSKSALICQHQRHSYSLSTLKMANSQWYSVYKLKFTLAVQDPDMPQPRYHTVVFVETDVDGGGTKFHVIGDITSGMSYESTTFHIEENSQPLHSKELLGYTNVINFQQEWDSILKNIPPPPKQKAFNIETMKTESVEEWDPNPRAS